MGLIRLDGNEPINVWPKKSKAKLQYVQFVEKRKGIDYHGQLFSSSMASMENGLQVGTTRA